MSALSTSYPAEEEEKCNCNRVAVKRNPTSEQLSTIEKGCKCIMLSSDSYKSDKTEYIIEAHAAGANRRPQSVKRSKWDEFEQEKQKFRNPKIPGTYILIGRLTCFYINVSWIMEFLT